MTEISVHTREGNVKIEAEIVGNLALHYGLRTTGIDEDYYIVSHVQSGRRIAIVKNTGENIRTAILAEMQSLSPIFDTLPEIDQSPGAKQSDEFWQWWKLYNKRIMHFLDILDAYENKEPSKEEEELDAN